MRPNPIDNRDALAKLPRFTQRFWTWLTGLTHSKEPPRKPMGVTQHLLCYLFVVVLASALSVWSCQTLFNATSVLA
ncbi:hypothetical protein JY96_06360 [Aquabacterium sp. NJ1]|nr:hypothetical protein JY96_06360 [Aquabacterium sp. NJ1]